MLNLLFISDSPKVELIKKELQPLFKVIIDVVTDFDRGMKDVFEKRPAFVCIQEQIGTVSAESVARHIQMLLGNGAPAFILLHSGNSKAKVINGLFEHLVDLSLSNDQLIENILAKLKTLLGNQWGKVFVPPKPAPDKTVTPEKISQAAQLKTEQNAKTVEEHANANIATDTFMLEEKVAKKPSSPEKASKKSADSALQKPDSTTLTSPPVPPAEAFRVSQNTSHIEDYVSEDIPFASEKNYRFRFLFMRRSYVIALVSVVTVAGGWYLLTQKSQRVNSLKQRFLPSSVAKQAPATPTTTVTAIPAQKPIQPPAPPPVATPSLPSFIPKGGLDSTFAQKNPGWNRYVGEKYDFRVFTATGRIEAVQVLSISEAIPESLIESVLKEFIGISKYQRLSRSTKDGVRIESGKVQDKGEIKIYRKNGSVMAFVVSVN